MSGMDNTSYTVRTYTGGAGAEFMLDSDYVVIYKNTGLLGAYLPTPRVGRRIWVVNASSSGVNIISQSQLDGIPGAAVSPTAWAHFICDGVNWFTMGMA